MAAPGPPTMGRRDGRGARRPVRRRAAWSTIEVRRDNAGTGLVTLCGRAAGLPGRGRAGLALVVGHRAVLIDPRPAIESGSRRQTRSPRHLRRLNGHPARRGPPAGAPTATAPTGTSTSSTCSRRDAASEHVPLLREPQSQRGGYRGTGSLNQPTDRGGQQLPVQPDRRLELHDRDGLSAAAAAHESPCSGTADNDWDRGRGQHHKAAGA